MTHRVLLILIGLIMIPAAGVRAQLISPGKLAAPHADVEGIRQCTQCHELGQRGVANSRCLGCHTLVEARLKKGDGYHATVAKDNCAQCHKDHRGRTASLLRFDTASFKHETAGWRLKGAHAEQTCRECHAPSRIEAADVRQYRGSAGFLAATFLGLSESCQSCHQSESPHGRQFGNATCQDCHDERSWDRAPGFNHDEARYRLTGRHQTVDCAACHTKVNDEVRYRGVRFATCADCHQDPHRGRMAGSCASCHATADWQRVDTRAVASTFDHTRTTFALKGAHMRVKCEACHRASRDPAIRLRFAAGSEQSTFARPMAQTCASCHVDPHPRSYAAAGGKEVCTGCHTVSSWAPPRYEVEQHNRTGTFVLDGAHAVTACTACHRTRAAPVRTCAACHAQDDPHRGAFGKQSCADCHDARAFKGVRLDHKRVAHMACAACHADRDPHDGQFGKRGCGECHGTESFRLTQYDHRRTAFPLDGAHIRVACGDCHHAAPNPRGSLVTKYRPLPARCQDCHGGGR